MATSVLIPVSEYLAATYHPDRDYVDGELLERNMGEESHAELQAIITGIFRENRERWKIRVLTEARVQTSSTHFRIPDICVVPASRARGRIIHYPPLLCIEILSPEDRLSALQDKSDDYFELGVENVWIIDPRKKIGYYATRTGFEKSGDNVLRVPQTEIAVSLAEVFEELES